MDLVQEKLRCKINQTKRSVVLFASIINFVCSSEKKHVGYFFDTRIKHNMPVVFCNFPLKTTATSLVKLVD